MTHNDIVRTADICDENPNARVLEALFHDYAARSHFHGEVVTFATYEDNNGLRKILARGGNGKVLVVDGRASRRRALCGGNIAAEAEQHGWEGLVIYGCIRDQHEFRDLNLGVKAIGTTPMRPRHDGIGLEGVVLNFAGMQIRPGEYLYADRDGIIITDQPVHG
ncbi:MAG: ribonuclease E activity regulator RraA [Acidiferrobacterales bacterium]|nr:ribonuclease E activity regulator RraA [Gammaproteobacteria bacterium]